MQRGLIRFVRCQKRVHWGGFPVVLCNSYCMPAMIQSETGQGHFSVIAQDVLHGAFGAVHVEILATRAMTLPTESLKCHW